MNPKDPVILGSTETQMMASMFDFGYQFLDPIADADNKKLADLLVSDMQRVIRSGVFDQT